MTPEKELVLIIKGAISELPAAQREAVEELADHIRRALVTAGDPVASMALALVGAEAAARE